MRTEGLLPRRKAQSATARPASAAATLCVPLQPLVNVGQHPEEEQGAGTETVAVAEAAPWAEVPAGGDGGGGEGGAGSEEAAM